MAKKRCRKCGRQYEPADGGDGYCSAQCRMAGHFIGGGGDTTKPGAVREAAALSAARGGSAAPARRAARVRKDDARYARVRLMFTLPPSERWAVARGFDDDERAYAKRLARREEMEAARFSREWDWDVGVGGGGVDGSDGGSSEEAGFAGDIGDSDDGSV